MAIENDSPELPFGFNVIGFISANLGLGVAGRNTIRLLTEQGFPVSIVDIDPAFGRAGHDRSFDHLKPPPGGEVPYAINIFHINPPEIYDVLERNPRLQRAGAFNVVVPFWELPLVPRAWIPIMQALDLVLAPTHYIEYIMASQVSGVAVRHYPQTTFLPERFLAERPRPDRAGFGLPQGAAIFITGFEMFSDINRKNSWAVLRAFERAFTKNDNAVLVIKVNSARACARFASETESLRAFAAENGRVFIWERTLPYEQVLSLYASCDALVSLHRAEGLGLSPMEAMFLGMPVIATGWSGNMEFMNDLNSCLVPCRLVPVNSNSISSYKPSYVGGPTVWAEPDIGHAATWMRRLAADRGLREAIGSKARADMLARHEACRKGEVFRNVRRLYENRRRAPAGANGDRLVREHANFHSGIVVEAGEPLADRLVLSFLSDLTEIIEKGRFGEALTCYDERRKKFTKTIPELARVDAMMEALRDKTRAAPAS